MTLISHKGLYYQHPLPLTLLSLLSSLMRCSIPPLFQLICFGTVLLEEALAHILSIYLLLQLLTSGPSMQLLLKMPFTCWKSSGRVTMHSCAWYSMKWWMHTGKIIWRNWILDMCAKVMLWVITFYYVFYMSVLNHCHCLESLWMDSPSKTCVMAFSKVETYEST